MAKLVVGGVMAAILGVTGTWSYAQGNGKGKSHRKGPQTQDGAKRLGMGHPDSGHAKGHGGTHRHGHKRAPAKKHSVKHVRHVKQVKHVKSQKKHVSTHHHKKVTHRHH